MPDAAAAPSKQRATSAVAALVPLGVMVWVIDRNGGMDAVGAVVTRLSLTWPLLLVPYGVNALITVLAYRTCLPDGGRAVPLSALVRIERGGSALNAILPLGDSSGNVAKVALLRHWYTSDELVAAGLWGSLGTGLCNAFAGVLAIVASLCFDMPAWGAGLVAGVSILLSLPAMLAFALVGRGLARRVAHLLTRIPSAYVRTRRARMVTWCEALDRHLASAAGPRRSDFMRLVAWKLLCQIVRVGELWLVIALLGIPHGLGAALVYNGMTRSVQQIFAFVPGRLGVLELASAVLFDAMDMPRDLGLQVAFVLRFTYVVNLGLSGTALAGLHALATRYPPRTLDDLLARRASSEEGRT